MEKTTNYYKKAAIKAVSEYREKLLKEFLLERPKLEKRINTLLDTGVDKECLIVLKAQVTDDEYFEHTNVVIEEGIKYATIGISTLKELKESLHIDKYAHEDEVVENFDEVLGYGVIGVFSRCPEFCKMMELEGKYIVAKKADETLY